MGALPTAQGGAPSGGTMGQALTKNSNTNYDYGWSSVSSALLFTTSLVNTAGTVTLVNDDSPGSGVRWFYGTDVFGVKGWQQFIVPSGQGGIESFLDLNDTPNSYSGQANKVVSVNGAENALVFTAAGGGGTVTTTGSPANGNLTKFSGATSITNGDLSGDVTTSSTLATTIANDAVTFAKFQNVSTNILLGRATASSGDMEELTALPFALSGDVATTADSNTTTLATVNSNVGSFTNTNITVNGKGLVTAAANGTATNAVGGSITYHGDSAYSILSTDKIVATNATFTAARSWTLPAASTVTAGYSISVIDLQATLTSTNRINLLRNGSDTIQPGSLTQTLLTQAGQGIQLTSDGVSKWTITYPSPAVASANGQVMVYSNNNAAWEVSPVTLSIAFNASPTAGKIAQAVGTDWGASTSTWPGFAGTAGKIVVANGTNWVASTPTFPNASATSGKNIQSDGTNWVASTPTWPATAGTSRKIVVSDGTNLVSSTETWAVPGTSGNLLTSDGTNWTSAAQSNANSRVTAQTAANSSIATFTNGAADASFEVSMNMNVTAATALSTSLNCDYTDESSTARTMIFPVTSLAGSFLTGGLVTATGAFETPQMHIRCKASTVITLYTATGTFTSVTYSAGGFIKQLK